MMVGDLVRSGEVSRERVSHLVHNLFDGKRELPLGGRKMRIPNLSKMTPHMRDIIITAMLMAEVVEEKKK